MIDRRLTFALVGLLVNAGCGGEGSPTTSLTTPTALSTPTPTCAASQISIVNARFDTTQRVCALGDTTSRVRYEMAFDFVNASDLPVSITAATHTGTCVPGSGFSNCQGYEFAYTLEQLTPTTIPARGTTTVRLGVSHSCYSTRDDNSGYFEWRSALSVSTSCGSAGASTSNTHRLVYQ